MPYTNDILGHYDAPVVSPTDSATDVNDVYVFYAEQPERDAIAAVPSDQMDNAFAAPASHGSLDSLWSNELLTAFVDSDTLM